MSKQYLEAVESIDSLAIMPDRIRADITGKTDAEIAEIKALIVDIMAGTNYRLVRHTCGHDEGSGCTSEEL